jgi:hypothetical protein
MLVTTHAASGALIGAVCRSPLAAAAAGWCSHFALDTLPHWGSSNPNRFLRVARIDGVTMLASAAALLAATPRHRRACVAAGVAGAVAPDLNKPVAHFFNRQLYPAALDRFHGRIQTGREADHRLGADALRAAALTTFAWRTVRRLR